MDDPQTQLQIGTPPTGPPVGHPGRPRGHSTESRPTAPAGATAAQAPGAHAGGGGPPGAGVGGGGTTQDRGPNGGAGSGVGTGQFGRTGTAVGAGAAAAGGRDAAAAAAAAAPSIRLSPKQIAFLNRQLASMARLNMPLAKGLRIMAQEVTDEDLRTVVEGIERQLSEGKTLQEALSRYPASISHIYLELLRAGGSTGNRAIILDELTRYTETLARVRTRLRDAMLYPLVVATLTVVFVLFFFWDDVPQFEGLFRAAGRLSANQTPAITRALFVLSDVLRNPVVLVLGFPLAVAVVAYAVYKVRRGWETYDEYMFRLPVFGGLIKQATLLKVTRTMRDLLVNGVSMVNTLKLTARVAGNNRIRRKLEEIRASVEEGGSFARTLAGDDVFPETMVWKLQMGEEKGIIEEALGEIAGEFETEIEATTSYLTSVISPVMLIGLASVLMLLMASLYPQLIRISSQVGQ